MDINAYISSGIIENYVLGLASPEEAREVESLSVQYPEIKEAIANYETILDKYARLHTVAPPPELKEKIWNSLQEPDKKTSPDPDLAESSNTKIINTVHPVMRYMTAASIILLVGSLALNLVFYSKFRDYRNKYARVQSSQQQMVAQNQAYQSQLEKYQHDIAVIKDTAMQPVVMKGVSEHPGMMATVFWNKQSGAVYLDVSKLPPPPSGMQYQLWAIIDGKPVSAGMCDMSIASTSMQKMVLSTIHAQAFAITLEKAGGSDVPTLSAMYVMGKV